MRQLVAKLRRNITGLRRSTIQIHRKAQLKMKKSLSKLQPHIMCCRVSKQRKSTIWQGESIRFRIKQLDTGMVDKRSMGIVRRHTPTLQRREVLTITNSHTVNGRIQRKVDRITTKKEVQIIRSSKNNTSGMGINSHKPSIQQLDIAQMKVIEDQGNRIKSQMTG